MSNVNYVISDRFRRTVSLHILKNGLQIEGTPLLLGISGPSGYGKTFQTEMILRENGVRVFPISGGELKSPQSGQPAQLIRSQYLNASKAIAGTTGQSAVVINDIDAGAGDMSAEHKTIVQYTINRQSVFAKLMNLVDRPEEVEGKPTCRIPIIITGNDFTKLYEPLTRPGRMVNFTWRPTPEETVNIVSCIFPELSHAESAALVAKFSNEPIAFFSQLRSTIVNEKIWQLALQHGIRNILATDRSIVLAQLKPKLSIGQLLETAQILSAAGFICDHLRGLRQPDIKEVVSIQNDDPNPRQSQVNHILSLQNQGSCPSADVHQRFYNARRNGSQAQTYAAENLNFGRGENNGEPLTFNIRANTYRPVRREAAQDAKETGPWESVGSALKSLRVQMETQER